MSSHIEAPLPPKDERQAVDWVAWALAEMAFHPDTPGRDYVNFATGKPCFVGKSLKRFDEGLQAAYDLLPDIYATTVELADYGEET